MWDTFFEIKSVPLNRVFVLKNSCSYFVYVCNTKLTILTANLAHFVKVHGLLEWLGLRGVGRSQILVGQTTKILEYW